METQLSFIDQHISSFDSIKHVDQTGEYWLARELMAPLGYHGEFRFFDDAITRAKMACTNSGGVSRDHFVEAHGMVSIGSGAQRAVKDYRLTRYACYLVAMNGDPRKQEISDAQTYFAIQTHRQELHDAEPTSPEIAALKLAVAALEAHERRLANLEAWQQECRTQSDAPLSLPDPTVGTPDKPTRAAINQIVRSAARRRGCPESYLWNGLYRELKYRKGFDVEARARNSKRERLDIIEECGLIEELYAIACEALK